MRGILSTWGFNSFLQKLFWKLNFFLLPIESARIFLSLLTRKISPYITPSPSGRSARDNQRSTVPFALSVVKQHLNLSHLAYKQTFPSPIFHSALPPRGIRERSSYCTRIGRGKGGSGHGGKRKATNRLLAWSRVTMGDKFRWRIK